MTDQRAPRPTRANALITITGEGTVVDLNEGSARIFGVRLEDAVGHPVSHFVALAEARAPGLAELAALLADPSALVDRELELTASGPDGRPFAAELTVAQAGVRSALFIIWIRDISAQNAEAIESARRSAMLAHGEKIAGIGSWDWDLRTGELRWSDNLFRLFGVNPGTFTPTLQDAIERMHADDRGRVRHNVATAVATGHLDVLEFRLVRVDGTLRRMRSIVASVEQEDGAPQRFLGTVQDVTERLQIAREIAGHIAIEEVLAAWAPLEDGAERLLARLGEAMDFAVGVLWLRRDDALIARSVWNPHAVEASDLEAARHPLHAGPDQALSVEAWLSRQPVLVVDLADRPAFEGQDAALQAGLRGAVALPAVSGDFTFAVLEFYSRESLQPSETLLRSLTGMGHELGHFFARRTGELRPHELTARERQILQLAAQGMSAKTIAQHLTLSPLTVKSHFQNIYAKWGISDRASAVAKGLREGLIR
jgi:DNA-binding NarL/FixJ family response regulator/PAS domain-containing protein